MGELSWRERGRLWLRLGLRLGLALLFLWVVRRVVLPLVGLLMPFVLALVLAWILNPPIRWLQKKLGAPRKVLSLIFILLFLALVGGLVAGLIYTLVNQVLAFLQNWQPVWEQVMGGVNSIAAAIEDLLKPLPAETYNRLAGVLDNLIAWLGSAVPEVLTGLAGNAGSFALGLPSLAVSLVIFMMAAYFISADYPHLRFRLTQRVPREFRGFLSQVKHVAFDAFGGYVKAELILSSVIFLILVVGFLVMGEPYALLLAFILAVMDFIPIIGSGTAMVPWAVIDIALGNYAHAAELMVVWGIIAVFRRVAEPKVVGNQTGLAPIASLLSIYVGMRLGGVVGMILGPVVCLVVLNIARGGFFDNTLLDLRLATRDVGAILAGSREEEAGTNSKKK